MKWVLIKRFCELSGYSPKAVYEKKSMVWRENIHWKKAPDGRIFVNTQAVEKWVETGR